ncbi:MAG: hypothetical protein EOM69_11065, partial [Clostridia bacterium]|nr:hypothetical protein [Clostridia bacterium]
MGLNRFQYTAKDHAAIVEDCVSRIKERYGDKFNDFVEDSSVMMLIEAFAYQVDLLLFYLDRQANETYLPTAIERQNVINLCKLVGYAVSGARPAEVDLTFSLNEPIGSGVRIPKGAAVGTEGGVLFETKEDAVIPAGETSVVVGAVQG